MPFIQVHATQLSTADKRSLADDFTKVLSDLRVAEPYTVTVIFKDYDLESFASGGKLLVDFAEPIRKSYVTLSMREQSYETKLELTKLFAAALVKIGISENCQTMIYFQANPENVTVGSAILGDLLYKSSDEKKA
ncbi:MAG: hypothetical protein WCI30_05000 [Clostridia bacterium]